MKALILDNLWRLLFAFLAISFSDSATQIGLGNFDQIGLPLEMVAMERVGNALEAAGWFAVLLLSFRKNPLIAPELCVFLAGMLFFDVHTTWPLDMPLPPYFGVWGTVLAVIEVLAGFHLLARRKAYLENHPSHPEPPTHGVGLLVLRLALLLPVLTFGSSAWGVYAGDFNASGLPAIVLPLHTWVNAAEAGGWLLLLLAYQKPWLKPHAYQLATFLAGMWCWDMITTMNLAMPVPPQQIVWGPISIFVMLLTAYELRKSSQ